MNYRRPGGDNRSPWFAATCCRGMEKLTGVMIIRAFIDARDGEGGSAKRRTMLIPDSAHGTTLPRRISSVFSV